MGFFFQENRVADTDLYVCQHNFEARRLDEAIRKNVTIDWIIRENVRAQLRVLVKRILQKYGYPPDKQKRATETVVMQAELLSREWAAETPTLH